MAATSRAHQKQTENGRWFAMHKMYNVYLNNYLADMFNISHKIRWSNNRFDEDAARPE